MVNWHLSKKVSADKFHMTVSWAQVFNSLRWLIFKLPAERFLVLRWNSVCFPLTVKVELLEKDISYLALAKSIRYDTFSKTTHKGIQLSIYSLGFLLSLESSHSYSLERLMFAKEAPTGTPCLCITSVTTSFTSGWYESKSNTLRTTFAKPSLGKAWKRKWNCIAVGLFQTK